MMPSAHIKVEIKSFWHIGTGKGSGNHLDALVEKDSAGLPRIPGRMLKGLLRDAVYRLEEWEHVEEGTTEELFGSSGFSSEGVPRNETQSGCLRFGNAELESALKQWLSNNAQQQDGLIQHMYRDIYSTAINTESGVAKQHSLRGIQATIPMNLTAAVSCIKTTNLDWQGVLNTALPLVQAIGAYRSRGFGHAMLTLEKVKS